jgi:hypothetical protein
MGGTVGWRACLGQGEFAFSHCMRRNCWAQSIDHGRTPCPHHFCCRRGNFAHLDLESDDSDSDDEPAQEVDSNPRVQRRVEHRARLVKQVGREVEVCVC